MPGFFRRRYFDLSWIDPEFNDESLLDIGIYDLAKCFYEVQSTPHHPNRHDVELFPFTVDDQLKEIRTRMESDSSFPISSLLTDKKDRQMLVVSFLAVLDLARSKEVLARQSEINSELWLFHPSKVDNLLKKLRDV